jgi:hypothetical protein
MPTVARKSFVFNEKQYSPGDLVPVDLLDKYQKETFFRAGFITERKEVVLPVVRKKTPVEVKPQVEVETEG